MSQDQEKTKEQRDKDNQLGCLILLGVIAALFVGGTVWNAIFGDDSDTTSSSYDTATVTMRGEITVYDQATCAGGPMVKVHAGGSLQMPKSFSAGNAPCVLNFSMDVPEGASSYKVQVDNLPARIFSPGDMRTTGGGYEVEMTVYGN